MCIRDRSTNDELGIFDTEDNLVGSFKFNEASNLAVLQGNDDLTSLDEGLENGEDMRIKIYHLSTGKTKEFIPVWQQGKANQFERGNLYDLLDLIPIDKSIINDLSMSLRPNPFHQTTILEVTTAQEGTAVMQIIAPDGQVISSSTIILDKGLNQLPIDLSSKRSGLYYIKIINNAFCKGITLVNL